MGGAQRTHGRGPPLTGPADNPLVCGPVVGGRILPGQGSDGPLGELALSRATVDRAAERRPDTAWIEQAWADPKTRVLVVSDSRALVDLTGGRHELVFVPPQDAPEGTRFFLGIDEDGIAYFGVSGALPAPGTVRSEEGCKALQLRQVGANLSARDAGLLTHAVALAN